MTNRRQIKLTATSIEASDEFLRANRTIARHLESIERIAGYARDRRKSDDILFSMYSLVLFAWAIWSITHY